MIKESAGVLIVNKQKRILLLKPSGKLDQSWSIPKGELDKGEDPLDAAARELKEEAGIIVDKNKLSYLGENKYKSGKKKIHAYFFNAKNLGNIIPKLNFENKDYLWAELNDAKTKVHEAQVGFVSLIEELLNG